MLASVAVAGKEPSVRPSFAKAQATRARPAPLKRETFRKHAVAKADTRPWHENPQPVALWPCDASQSLTLSFPHASLICCIKPGKSPDNASKLLRAKADECLMCLRVHITGVCPAGGRHRSSSRTYLTVHGAAVRDTPLPAERQRGKAKRHSSSSSAAPGH